MVKGSSSKIVSLKKEYKIRLSSLFKFKDLHLHIVYRKKDRHHLSVLPKIWDLHPFFYNNIFTDIYKIKIQTLTSQDFNVGSTLFQRCGTMLK